MPISPTNHRPFSLEVRLTFFISLATIIAFALFTSLILSSVKNHFTDQDIQDLSRIKMTLQTILQNPNDSEQQKVDKISVVLDSNRHVSVLMLNSDNRILYRSAQGPNLLPVLKTAHFANALSQGEVFQWTDSENMPLDHMRMGNDEDQMTYRILAAMTPSPYHGKNDVCTFLIAMSIDFHLHYINQLRHHLWCIAFAMSLLIVLIVLFAVHQGNKPLRQVSKSIKNITSEDLGVRLNPHEVPVELEQLVVSFNQMLGRIEDVFTRQANFSADIAHEIRTPITNLVTQTEIALSQSRSQKELEEVLYSSLEEYHRMAKMVSDMLFLAQAENHKLILERMPIDLRTETLKVFDFFEAWAEEREVGLVVNGQAATVEGDSSMLRRVINNLLSNAIRHTTPGQSVTVTLTGLDTGVELCVANPGPPIEAPHLPRLFDRFYRVDPARQRQSEGSGIGLAIVKSIIAAHHGKIHVESDTQSTRFIIFLPRSYG